MIDQRVELRYDLGAGLAMVMSEPITLDEWHTVTVSRNGRSGNLDLVGEDVCPVGGCVLESPGKLKQLNVDGDFSIGGVREYSVVSPSAGTEVGFSGCIGSLLVRHSLYLCVCVCVCVCTYKIVLTV